MTEILIELAKSLAVVTAVIWIPCGVIGLGWVIRFALRERRWWKAANEEAFDEEEYGEEVVYR